MLVCSIHMYMQRFVGMSDHGRMPTRPCNIPSTPLGKVDHFGMEGGIVAGFCMEGRGGGLVAGLISPTNTAMMFPGLYPRRLDSIWLTYM